jgi:methylaspartate ammonia-lyase
LKLKIDIQRAKKNRELLQEYVEYFQTMEFVTQKVDEPTVVLYNPTSAMLGFELDTKTSKISNQNASLSELLVRVAAEIATLNLQIEIPAGFAEASKTISSMASLLGVRALCV